MAIEKNITSLRLGLVVNNGVTATGNAKTATLSYGNVRIDATDQGLHDVGNTIGNLSDRALMSVKVTISADLEESI